MDSALAVDRLQFAFTITFHYLFPPTDDGPRYAHPGPAGPSRCALLTTSAASITTAPRVSGQKSSPSTSRWALSPGFQWISVRHELGAVFTRRRRSDRPVFGSRRRLLLLSGADLSGPPDLW